MTVESSQPLARLIQRARQRAAEPEINFTTLGSAGEAPLTAVQLGLWLHGTIHETLRGQLVTWTGRLDGALDVEALAAALSDVAGRHPRLGARLVPADGAPRLLLGAAPAQVRVLAGNGLDEDDALALLAAQWHDIDPENGPMFLATVLTCATDVTYLGLAVHHLVFDGASLGVVLDDLATRYRQLRGHGATRPAGVGPLTPVPFIQPAETTAPGAEFWRSELAYPPAPLRPLQRGDDAPPRISFSLGAPTAEALRATARRCRATVFMVVAAAVTVTIHSTGGGVDTLVGALLDLRTPQEREQVSYHLNTLPLRIRVGGPRARLVDVVERARQAVIAVMSRRTTPLSDALAAGREAPGGAGLQAPQITIDYLGRDDRVVSLDGVTCTVLDQVGGDPEFPLGVIVGDVGEDIEVELEPGPGFLDATAVRRFADVLHDVLRRLALDPDCTVGHAGDVPLFDRFERPGRVRRRRCRICRGRRPGPTGRRRIRADPGAARAGGPGG